ncbi:hypothetical protein IWZ00DRAFT_559462, partial [Phyllosticta capitalensis]
VPQSLDAQGQSNLAQLPRSQAPCATPTALPAIFNKDLNAMIGAFQQLNLQEGDNEKFPLGDFPPEIVLEVAQCLPMESRHALARTCKDLYHLLEPSFNSFDETARNTFLGFLDRDDLARAIEFERSGKDESFRACAGCKRLHSIEAFSEIQLFQQPRVRKCRGREGKFQLCEHFAISWEKAIKISLSFHPFSEDPDLGLGIACGKCQKHLHSCYLIKSYHWHSRPIDLGQSGFLHHKTFQITTYRQLTLVVPGLTINGARIRRILGERRWQVCPHTVTSAEQFYDLRHLQFQGTCVNGPLQIKNSRSLQESLWNVYECCKDPGCVTEFWIEVQENKIFLVANRDLGALTKDDPNHYDWLVQCGLS